MEHSELHESETAAPSRQQRQDDEQSWQREMTIEVPEDVKFKDIFVTLCSAVTCDELYADPNYRLTLEATHGRLKIVTNLLKDCSTVEAVFDPAVRKLTLRLKEVIEADLPVPSKRPFDVLCNVLSVPPPEKKKARRQ
jgi:hypothetical protein